MPKTAASIKGFFILFYFLFLFPCPLFGTSFILVIASNDLSLEYFLDLNIKYLSLTYLFLSLKAVG